MALQTYTANASSISTLLANNTTKDITPSDVRTVHTNALDGIWNRVITSITDTDSPYTLDTDATQILLTDSTSGAITVNLPTVASSSGVIVTIKHNGSANSTTIDGNSSETIDGATTKVLSTQYDVVQIACDGTAWYIVSN